MIEEVLDGCNHPAEHGGRGGQPAWHEHAMIGTVDLDDLPMTTGADPVAAVISSTADSAWDATRRRCWLKSVSRERSHTIGRTCPPRRSTATLAYISSCP